MTALEQLILRSPILSAAEVREALHNVQQVNDFEWCNICLSHERLRMQLEYAEKVAGASLAKLAKLHEIIEQDSPGG